MELVRYAENEIWKEKITVNGKNVIENTIDNLVLILENDENLIPHIRYNEFNHNYEYWDGYNIPRPWTDTDDAICQAYIERSYGIYDRKKFKQALAIVMDKHGYNPLKDLIEDKKWDGVERIDNFLKDILQCESDTDDMINYHREVSRMIFFGGIARLYHPGIKFDYMPVFVGEQGLGKSTIIDWLALNTKYYKEITTVKGQEGIECLEGGWICEFAELLALTGSQNVQSIKAFITRTADRYRRPYAEYTSTLPRQCIFIGTTNESEFLTDTTGNRRYLPVEIHIPRGKLFENEKYIKDYILSCWREALYKMNNDKNNFYLTIPHKYMKIVDSLQEHRVIEDPRLSELENFLSDMKVGDKVCSRMIFAEAFRGITKDATKGDFKIIGSYMNKFKNWKRFDNTITFEKYGKQKYWIKVREDD